MNGEILSLNNFVFNQLFFEGDNRHECLFKLSEFRHNPSNRIRFLKLVGVCKRLELVERLHHPVYLIYKDDSDGYWLDRLAVYLTATCIDVLADKDSGFKLFPKWLEQVLNTRPLTPNLSTKIDAFIKVDSEKEVTTQLIKCIGELHEEYLDEAGNRRLFKKFFLDLPEWLQNWLAETYMIIEKGDIYDNSQLQKWIALDDKKKCEKIADYLYKEVRNKHTHTVDYAPTMNSENHGTERINFNGIVYGFSTFPDPSNLAKNLSNPVGKHSISKLSIGLRIGVAESDVIRLLVISELRSWLNIKDDDSLLDKFWHKAELSRASIRFLFELKRNQTILEQWCLNYVYLDPDKHHGPLNILDNVAVLSLIEKCKVPSISNELSKYLEYITYFNDEIDKYHASQVQIEASARWRKEAEFLETFAKSKEAVNLLHSMRVIQSDILKLILGGESDPDEYFFARRMRYWLSRYGNK